jgi:hypothetical protein
LTGGMTSSIIGDVMLAYVLGWVTLLTYLPLRWWRHRTDAHAHEKQRVGG